MSGPGMSPQRELTGSAPGLAGRALLLTASTGCAMTVLDTNVVGVVLPTIARQLGASFSDIEWVIGAYVLCFAALLLPAGAMADRFGRKRVFLLGIAGFAVASLACGLAPSASALYVARAAQGVGAAFLLAPALAIIGHAYHDEHQRARAWALWGGVMGLTMVLSPLLGGAIGETLGWRWAFHVNVPVCIALALAVWRFIPESREATPRPLDMAGIGLFAAAMFSLTWALIVGPAHGWGSAAVFERAAAALALFVAFVMVQRRVAHPMLDLSLFRAWPFVGAMVAMFAYAACAQVMASLLPQFLQNARGKSALAAGVAMLPFALAMLILPQVGRRLGRWLPTPRMLALGLAVTAVGNGLLAQAAWGGEHTTRLSLMIAMAILGCGGGLLNGETQKAIMGTIPPGRAGMASGISTTCRFTGILIGFSALGATLAAGVHREVAMRLATLTAQTSVATQGSDAGLAAGHAAVSMTGGGAATASASANAARTFADAVAAGDFTRALADYPASLADALTHLAREAYGMGFGGAFLAAGVFAALAAVFVYVTMSRPAGAGQPQPGRHTPSGKMPETLQGPRRTP